MHVPCKKKKSPNIIINITAAAHSVHDFLHPLNNAIGWVAVHNPFIKNALFIIAPPQQQQHELQTSPLAL